MGRLTTCTALPLMAEHDGSCVSHIWAQLRAMTERQKGNCRLARQALCAHLRAVQALPRTMTRTHNSVVWRCSPQLSRALSKALVLQKIKAQEGGGTGSAHHAKPRLQLQGVELVRAATGRSARRRRPACRTFPTRAGWWSWSTRSSRTARSARCCATCRPSSSRRARAHRRVLCHLYCHAFCYLCLLLAHTRRSQPDSLLGCGTVLLHGA